MGIIEKYISFVDIPIQPIDLTSLNKRYTVDKLLGDFEANVKSHGLLIGQVQSGKTGRIIEVLQTAINKYGYDYIFCLGGTNSALTEQSVERIGTAINGRCYEGINDFEEYIHRSVFVIMKNKDVVAKMLNFISNHCESKILIIDDESDFGSVNTKEYSNPSKINELITESYKEITVGGLLSVTATPVANLINSQNAIPIKFVWTLPINDNYTGLDFFNSVNHFYISDLSWFSNSHETSEKVKCEFSIYLWLIQTYWMFKREDKIKLSDLLIYVSDRLEDHTRLEIRVKAILRNLNFNQELVDQFCLRYQIPNVLVKELKEFYGYVGTPEIMILNGSQSDWREKLNLEPQDRNSLRIIIGGVFLSRGVTYPHLTTELFTCLGESISIDTLLQKCRWFGYRKTNNRYKYMNVITTPRIASTLQDVVQDYNKLFTNNIYGESLDPLLLQQELKEIDEQIKDLNIKGTSHAKGR